MAIASASAQRRLKDDTVVFGEIGLGGEVRSVTAPARRVSEANKLGFIHSIGPLSAKKSGVSTPVRDLRQALIDYLN